MKRLFSIFVTMVLIAAVALFAELAWRKQYSFVTTRGIGFAGGWRTNLYRLTDCGWLLFDHSTNTVVVINYCGNVTARPSRGFAEVSLVYPVGEDPSLYAGGSTSLKVLAKRNTFVLVRDGNCEYVEFSESDIESLYQHLFELDDVGRANHLLGCIFTIEKGELVERVIDCLNLVSNVRGES